LAFHKRFEFVFLGNGMKLGKTLSPLEPLKLKINVMDGLYVHALTGQGIHPARDVAVSYPARTFRKAPSQAAEKLNAEGNGR
jgi:hypothetical protein